MNNRLPFCFSQTTRAALLITAAVLAAPTASAQYYSFDTDAQGWRVFNIGMSGHFPSATSTVAAPWVASGGLNEGCLRVGDLAQETCIGAPAAALGARSDLYGQSIVFDAFFRTGDNVNYSILVLAGESITLYYPHAKPPLNAAAHFDILLTEAGWHVNSDTGPAATQAQFQGVLANLKGIYIRAEWNTGVDDTSIDTIVIGPACPADLTHDGGVDLSDFFEFFNCWDLSEPCADVDHSTEVDLGDFFEFFNHFDLGC